MRQLRELLRPVRVEADDCAAALGRGDLPEFAAGIAETGEYAVFALDHAIEIAFQRQIELLCLPAEPDGAALRDRVKGRILCQNQLWMRKIGEQTRPHTGKGVLRIFLDRLRRRGNREGRRARLVGQGEMVPEYQIVKLTAHAAQPIEIFREILAFESQQDLDFPRIFLPE